MDHSQAPILDALEEFRRRKDYVYGPPGHKQGRGVDVRVTQVMGDGVFASDVLTLNGLDDRRQSQGILSQAEELLADAVNADQAFFSTCGSSLSVKSAMLAVAGPGEKILLSRNAHKSVVAGFLLSGQLPVWVQPKWDEELALAHPPEVDDVRRLLSEHPDAKGMLLISPTDWGTCADIASVTEICHAADIPVIVDEAWGAYFPFHEDAPTWAMDVDADLAVVSVHKTGMAIEQSSVFHLKGDRVDPTVLSQRSDLLSTTSPSSLVYGSIDGWRRQMVEHGKELIAQAMASAARLREGINGLAGLSLMGEEVLGRGGAYELDPLKLTMDVEPLGITGYQAAEWLRAEHHVDLGAADTRRIQAQISHGDDADTEGRLLYALRDLVHRADSIERPSKVALPPAGSLELEVAMRPRDAFFADTEVVPADQAVGRIGAELISPYPPGVCAVCPGEVINQEVVDYLRTGAEAGMLIPDAADPQMKSFKVVQR